MLRKRPKVKVLNFILETPFVNFTLHNVTHIYIFKYEVLQENYIFTLVSQKIFS